MQWILGPGNRLISRFLGRKHKRHRRCWREDSLALELLYYAAELRTVVIVSSRHGAAPSAAVRGGQVIAHAEGHLEPGTLTADDR